jgi:hypothetical protein
MRNHNRSSLLFACLTALLLAGCGQPETSAPATSDNAGDKPLFGLVSPDSSGLVFSNMLYGEEQLPIYSYINFYSGGGVAIGDINNDGLSDVFFTGNMVPNKLFLNIGELKFKEATKASGIMEEEGWSFGVTMADANGDGWLDIYVCKAYSDTTPGGNKNLFYLNNGDGTFKEVAEEWGIADARYSTQATFFDYDKDGDLDLYVGNHPVDHNITIESRLDKWDDPSIDESDGFYRNDGNGFTDVTKESGLLNYGWMLGAVATDIDQDGWVDLYIANDHAEPDQMMINNGDGTFTNKIKEKLRHTSVFAMGIDIADFNNDKLLDIACVDMMAESNYRQKTNMESMNPDAFNTYVANGYQHQYMRNVLQLNNGNGTFSEIAQYAGIDKTDWSWATLFMDFDNDGDKDLFISNGNKLDYRNNDFRILYNARKAEAEKNYEVFSPEEVFSMIPSQPMRNYFYENDGSLKFKNRSYEVGFELESFSNGAAVGDLDNDGDLDLVVNNIALNCFLLENKSDQTGFLRIAFEGPTGNPFGMNAKVTVTTSDRTQYQELTATRGFLSAVEPVLHFGVGDAEEATVKVTWPDGGEQVLDVSVPQLKLVLRHSDAGDPLGQPEQLPPLMVDVTDRINLSSRHYENDFNDFKREILLPHKMSTLGPNIAATDLNEDGKDDFYVGGAAGQEGTLFLSSDAGYKASNGPWSKHASREDMGVLFFDANGDNLPDLYVASGGNEAEIGTDAYLDRLYMNTGSGFVVAQDALPRIDASTGPVVAADFDGDGDQDLFVGGRQVPGKYPFPATSFLLLNEGGNFANATADLIPDIEEIGMVTSAVWNDIDQDNDLDLVVAGEWMGIKLFLNNGNTFVDVSEEWGLTDTEGLWFSLAAEDMDGDGDADLVVGNYGLNTKFKASKEQPFEVFCGDFDQSGTYDIVLGKYVDGTCVPVRGRQCSSEQMPAIAKKVPTYHEWGTSSITEIYGKELEQALHLQAKTLASVYLENSGTGFVIHKLPTRVQFSSVFGIIPMDINNDGNKDLVVAGNLYGPEVETVRNDASIGVVLIGDGQGGFNPMKAAESGFSAYRDVKDICLLDAQGKNPRILVANNDDVLQIFELNRREN